MMVMRRLLGLFLLVMLVACGEADVEPTPDGVSVADTATAASLTKVMPTATTAVMDATPPVGETVETAVLPTATIPPTETVMPTELAPSPTPEVTTTPERSYAGTVAAPEFPAELEWLNTGRPLSLTDDLRGKVVLLDFWTYGCINCVHVIPDLKALEEKYADELVVIGVHSAKFTNEAETENIRQIVLRYELEHPVINDKDFLIWSTYGVNAWPTFVLIDPEGKVLGSHSGEGIYELFDAVIGGMVTEFDGKGLMDRTPLDLQLEREALVNSPLLFPGKVLADEENDRLFIADSNHHRIVITDFEGGVLEVIGSGRAGLEDGGYETAAFFRPQGLTLADSDTLYVADTENHAIREVNLATKLVQTVAGTGEQGRYRDFEGRGTSIALNSPWDVMYYEGIVYIAMAGQHQLWVYEPDNGIARAFSGSGREALQDGSRLEAGLNQPSGLATNGVSFFVADSEASAIRQVEFDTGHITTIVGTGLFDFGDVDGQGDEVRLQHPLGLAFAEGQLYMADTYNHKIKIVTPETQEVVTFLGSGVDGWRDGVKPQFDEPGGIAVADGKLFIADTNNHVIRVANLATREVSTLVLIDSNGLLTRQTDAEAYRGEIITLPLQTVVADEQAITLDVMLPEGYKLNELAPFSVEWLTSEGIIVAEADQLIREVTPDLPLTVAATFTSGEHSITADLVVYYCEAAAESLCLIEQVRLLVPVVVAEDGGTTLTVAHTITLPTE